jgi:hypothetical protein
MAMLRDGDVQSFAAASPPDGWLRDFERDGFATFPSALSAAGREGIKSEFLSRPGLVEYLQQSTAEREQRWRAALKPGADPGDGGGPHMGSGGNLNAAASPCDGPFTDQLLDAPFVRALLSGAMGPHYHLTTPPHGTVRSQVWMRVVESFITCLTVYFLLRELLIIRIKYTAKESGH